MTRRPIADSIDLPDNTVEADLPVVTVEPINPEAARLIDDFVQAHLPGEPWRQQAMFHDREALKVNLAALFLTK